MHLARYFLLFLDTDLAQRLTPMRASSSPRRTVVRARCTTDRVRPQCAFAIDPALVVDARIRGVEPASGAANPVDRPVPEPVTPAAR